eukprot:m.129182 g.129182  ORF g.129182 m.129182 type:complete len:197 (+) comp22312_c0_seq3:390-980(+)
MQCLCEWVRQFRKQLVYKCYDCNCGSYDGPPKQCSRTVGADNLTKVWESWTCKAADPTWECWRGCTGRKMGGMWYSTSDAGYCGDGSGPSTPNCTWRVAEFVKRVNKTCSDSIIYAEVETTGASCFDGCSDSGIGPGRNATSPCWIGCFYDTVLGPDARNPGGSITGMPVADLIAAWNLPFASDSPATKGCPALKP